MQSNFRIFLLVFSLFTAACSDAPDEVRPAGTITVTVGSDPELDIRSRTAIEPDGMTVRWIEGDQIALWAVNSNNEAKLEAHPFRLWHYNATFNAAKFTGDIPALPEDNYHYYAVSPLPASKSGTTATFKIPAVQEFKVDESPGGGELTPLPYDIMVADPVSAKQLVEGDNSKTVNLAFRHKTHLLKFTVQSNRLGEKVTRVDLTFPEPVVGDFTVDITNPNAAPVLTNASNKLTILFDKPVEAGTTVIAAIAPINMANSSFQIVSIGETCESEIRDIPGRVFSAGHTTPINYNIPATGREFTRLTFSLPADRGISVIGEAVEKVKLVFPEGVDFGYGQTETTFIEDTYTTYIKPGLATLLQGKTITVEYESEYTILSNTVTLPTMTEYGANAASLTVPALLTEDFSGVNGQGFDDGKDDGDGWGVALVPDGTEKSVDMNLPGWSGQRIGSKANTAVRINSCHHRPAFSGTNNRYNGSLTSPVLAIKPGKTVNIKVTFLANRSSNNTQGYFGTTTATGNPTYDNSGQSAVSVTTKDGYDTIDTPNEFTLSVTSAHRLSWNVTNDKSEGWGAKKSVSRHYLYIGNVKATIVK